MTFVNPYRDKPKPPPAQTEVEAGNYLLMLFRLLGVPMPRPEDRKAVERVGELLMRWWRNKQRDWAE
jgi:hypothetical protein